MTIERVLLTGGAGFLGRAILRELARRETSLSLKEIRVLDARPLADDAGVDVVAIAGDVRDPALLVEACRDVDAVIHTASRVDWGGVSETELEDVNLGGTENVLRACRETGVPRLIYTSTMDVVCGGGPVVRADETTPYPRTFINAYARTKALAEQRVLAAHGTPRRAREGDADATLATCALRPCGMYGEGDPYFLSRTFEIVREGKLPFRLGNGRSVFEHVYVGNVAHAHVCALARMAEPAAAVGGAAYFITDDTPPANAFDFADRVFAPLGHPLPPRSRSVPYPVALGLAGALEAFAWLARPVASFSPTLTRSSLRFVCHEHSFVGDKARRELGYAPRYGEAESLQRTVDWLRTQA